MRVGSFNSEEVLAWKSGIIYFNNADLTEIVNKLELWYGIDIVIENNSKRSWNLTAEFNNQSLESVLMSLSYIKDFKYEIQRDSVRISL